MKVLFWLSAFVVIYTFVGYGIILYILVRIRRIIKGKKDYQSMATSPLPSCSLIIAAYNEESVIREKIRNTLDLNYPKDRLEIIFVTDGSSDRTPEIIAEFPGILLLHEKARKGKIDAVHRAISRVQSEVMVFTDANTFLNKDALIHICRHYVDPTVGAVAGEKRVLSDKQADASSSGEGFYWKYESALKKWDSELYSVVGAAGELFSVRTSVYQPVGNDVILDDFMISMLIATKGFRIVYEPLAFAAETASQNVSEELKRKIRIAAGGIQSIIRLSPLLNIFNYGILSFQYISHRVLRWTITPFLLIAVFLLNVAMVFETGEPLYIGILAVQVLFYLLAGLGLLLEQKQLRVKALFVPYYFCVMNYAVLAGITRYFRKQQSASWEKVRRK